MADRTLPAIDAPGPGGERGDAPIDVSADRGGARVRLSGDWTIENAARLETRLSPDTLAATAGTIVIDGSDIGRFDTAGAWLVERTRRQLDGRGVSVSLTGFSEAQQILIAAVDKTGRTELPEPPKVSPVVRFLTLVGRGAAEIISDANALAAMLGEFIIALGGTLAWRRRMRWAAFVNHIDRAGFQAVPIIALMSFLIGMIIAQQGGFYFRSFGAELFVVDLVGVLVCREIGVLLTAIMVAGRSGSAFTAEIGSMKMREEIDALTVLGVSPVDVLVVPRLLALIVTLPILALVSDLAALAGAWVVTLFYIGVPTDTFLLRLKEALTVTYVMVGLVKAPFMALVIGLVACVEGMKVKGSAESLGEHTTASVVKAIFMVVVMDGIFAMFFASLGI
ncbi:ABC transporter permease [Chthonobacter rhizosphaerae]|uniref:ABC transporter permease n=1 Tax=Chthonobacter rhizosphaerae TaxID=2735553 RepID=UPI0015EF98D7|nr:MlaE family lipid ABC transporter permease subunit [Chthonobacter rhizosphaerae]